MAHTQEVERQAEGIIGEMKEHAVQGAQQAAEKVREGYERIANRAGESYDQARQLVRARPAQSVTAALACGMLIGFVLGLTLASR